MKCVYLVTSPFVVYHIQKVNIIHQTTITLVHLNYFAFEALPKNGIYYFTIVIPVDVKNDYAIGNSFLFTDQDSIKMWWRHTLWFYESEGKEQIPEEYIFYTCPPPPKE